VAILLRDPNDPPGLSRLINHEIDAALEIERAGEVRRDHIGASALGDPCDRRLAYQYAGIEPDRISGRSLRIFETGHALEALMSRWLRLAGFDLHDVDPNTGRQLEFSVGDDRVRGHVDAVITSGPNIGPTYPLLWEAKSLNSAGWTDLTNRGLRESKPGYFAQVQIYLSEFKLGACLLTALNKDTGALYHEIVESDPGLGQWFVARGIRIADIVDSGALPDRTSDTSQCRGCSWLSPCRTTAAPHTSAHDQRV